MAALDTFDWFVGTMVKNPNPEVRRLIAEGREYLLTLRSEDERQRSVDAVLETLRTAVRTSL
ncbi:MAG TPA: hypothetical protein VLY03_00740 [Bacteroidota bacterium]|nr:hypothetical protein [Bacteroidota bacterium]